MPTTLSPCGRGSRRRRGVRGLYSARTPHPARFARHPLPQGERARALVARAAATPPPLPPGARAKIPLEQRRSGYEKMSPATKAMQDDETSNPATLSVLDGEALW